MQYHPIKGVMRAEHKRLCPFYFMARLHQRIISLRETYVGMYVCEGEVVIS
jgi:hypothetical protein